MTLPRVKITLANGALGSVSPSPDGVLGLITTAVAVPATFALNTAYKLTSIEDLTALGVTEENNSRLYKDVSDFYLSAGTGSKAELWIFGVADTVTLAQMTDSTVITYARTLLQAANGRIRGLVFSRNPAAEYVPVVTNGVDVDVETAIVNAQALCAYSQDTYQAPIFALIEGRSYSGVPADLTDMRQATTNRVAVFIGDIVSDSGDACIGILAGRIAKIGVQRNIGRMKDGALPLSAAYIKDKAVGLADSEGIHDKGYITMRTFTGRVGIFFSDDPLCAKVSDDYSQLTARRTVDKAYRIAYDTLLDELLDELPVLSDGTLQPAVIKAWQASVENAISLQMTANGELSADSNDANDRGVQCFIDATQNVVSTSKVEAVIRVRPFGYSRYIDVELGFQTVTS
jgi:uncharacterized protein DUF2586